MVAYAAFLLLVWCTCLQHAGALKFSNNPSEGEDGGLARGTIRPRSSTPPGGCDLEWKGDKLPIILYEDNLEIVSPVRTSPRGRKKIRIEADVGVIIYCTGTGGFSAPEKIRPHRSSRKLFGFSAFCNSADGKLVVNRVRSEPLSEFIIPPKERIHGKTVNNMNDMLCENKIEDTVIATPQHCGHGMRYNIVTFELEFFIQIQVCFNTKIETTLWTEHILRGGVSPDTDKEFTWRQNDSIFKSNMKDLYININKPVSNNNDALKSLTMLMGKNVKPPQKVIAKGHLSPNADFKTDDERKATFYYINAVPQWHANNNGNWAHIVEVSVKNLAKKDQTDLTIITGGHETLQLRNVKTKNYVPISLGPSGRVPFPKFIWKVVINPAKTEGVAFVIINNPFIGTDLSPTAPNDLCEDVCDKLDSWFKKTNDRKSYAKGYMYCCRVDDLMKSISTIPSKYASAKKLLGEKNADLSLHI